MVKTYQQKYGEVYSECFCWYCESAYLHTVGSGIYLTWLTLFRLALSTFHLG